MARSEYIELRCRSAFSFLEGSSNPEDLIDRAAALGYPALALGDLHGLYGAPRFHKAAAAAGIKALVAAEVELADPLLPGRLYLLVENATGYRNLCRLLTRGHLGRDPEAARARGRPAGTRPACRVTWEDIEEHAAGLHCLAGGAEGPLARAIARGAAVAAASATDRLLGIFGRERLAIDIQRHLDPAEERLNRALIALAESCGVPLLATNGVCHATPEGRCLLDVMACIREGTTLDSAGRLLARNAERHLKPAAEMAALFSDLPGAVRRSREVAERATFTLAGLGYRFPDYPLPPGTTAAAYLRELTFRGARERYGYPLSPRVRRQLEHELGVITRLDLAGYFLIVWDLVQYCRRRGILAQGRGSAANSAVCYALGITAVDPVGMELLFERFLSEERGEWPDIDLDLPSGEAREEVIQYAYRRYGPHGAGMTATVITYRVRSAVREVGKVLGLPADRLDRLARLLHGYEYRDREDRIEAQLRSAGLDPAEPRTRLLVDLVERIQGLPRHLGQHTGGMVLAAGRLDEVVPLEPAAMPGRAVIQWDKDDCTDLGIIKVDLLGLGMLAALSEALPLVREHEGVELDLARLPQGDPAVYDLLQRADTVGVFQVESRAQMATLPRLRPERFYDLVVEVAIVRPGPIVGQMVHPYLRRRAGREPVTYPHPCLEPILARTLGVPLFQEQLLRIAMAAAGFGPGEAEELRRAMGFKRSAERMRQLEGRLRAGMTARGITGKAQEEIVRAITSFALYGFPESHAASFALIAYASAYLKVHHPAAFYCALLNAWPMGFYHPATLVQDGARRGVPFLPADVSRSEWRCTLERTAGGVLGVRLGLRYVARLRREAGERIAAERARRPFASIADVAQRAGLERWELERLAEAGALGAFGATRRQALWQAAAVERDPESLLARAGSGGDGGSSSPLRTSPLPEMSPREETVADYRAMGLTCGPHLLAHLRPSLARSGVVEARELSSIPTGRWVEVAGHVIVRQRPGTAKGFCFLTLEDETGLSNAVLTPATFARHRRLITESPLLVVGGWLERRDGVIHVRARRIEALRWPADLPPGHDFR